MERQRSVCSVLRITAFSPRPQWTPKASSTSYISKATRKAETFSTSDANPASTTFPNQSESTVNHTLPLPSAQFAALSLQLVKTVGSTSLGMVWVKGAPPLLTRLTVMTPQPTPIPSTTPQPIPVPVTMTPATNNIFFTHASMTKALPLNPNGT